jgi:hypothetical protein
MIAQKPLIRQFYSGWAYRSSTEKRQLIEAGTGLNTLWKQKSPYLLKDIAAL